MKKVFIICIALLTVMAISCKKDSTTTAKPSPVGFWKGKWSNTSPSTPPDIDTLYLLFRADGTLRQIYASLPPRDTTNPNKDSGTWVVTNDSIINWSNGFGESYSGVIRSNSTVIAGTWGNTPSSTDVGQFYIAKQ